MKKFMILITIMILGLGFYANLMAGDYYVRTDGSDSNDGISDDAAHAWFTIQHAVNTVSNPTTATIVIHVSGDTYTLNSDDIDINRSFTDLTIQGTGAVSTIVQAHATEGSATDRVFEVTSGETVTIKDMTIRHGKIASANGGGIYNAGTLTLTNCTLSGNYAGEYGGGIYNASGSTLTITNCTVSGNSASYSGGGIYAYGTLMLTKLHPKRKLCLPRRWHL